MSRYPSLTVSYPERIGRGPVQYVAAQLEPSRTNRGAWNVWNGGMRPIDTMPGDMAAGMFPQHAQTIRDFDRFR